LAQSFVELGEYCGLPLNPALRDKVKMASEAESSYRATAGRFIHGFWTGET